MALDIVEIGHPVLREVAREVDLSDLASAPVQNFIDELIDTCRSAGGAGIAANQVNNTWRIFMVEIASNPRYPYKPKFPLTVMVNPQITFLSSEQFDNFEGCLSIPNLRGLVPRCPHVRVQGYDRHGKPLDFEVRGISAGTFQHEQDHLDGVLFPDKVTKTQSYCTWQAFKDYHEEDFKQAVKQIEQRYNPNPTST